MPKLIFNELRKNPMNRRSFNQAAIAALLGQGFSNTTHAKAADSPEQFDRFGGWTEKKFEATGFFRVEKDDRWWFVTPEGNAFLSVGINHLHPDLWNQSFSREAWQKKLGIDNLNSPQFRPALREWFLEICREYGFNTVGVHTELRVVNTPRPAMPYIQPIRFVDIPHWSPEVSDDAFRDVFLEKFARHCDRLAKQYAEPARNDPFLLGYAMTDCPLMTEEDCRARPDVIGGARRKSRIGWPRKLRNMGASAAGKAAYVRTMREVYRDQIGDFNSTYGTTFDSFDALLAAENWRPHTELSNANETRDNIVFLQAVVDKYYDTTKSAIRRYDPNHMFFGDKLNANTDTVDTVLPITSKYTDILFYQMYGRYEVQKLGLDRWAKIANKPIVNGDSSYTMITEHMPRPYGPVADGLQQRAEWANEFFRDAFARPEFVGWHYCGLIDATQLIPRKQARQHSGILTAYGEPYPKLKEVIQTCTDEMYDIAQSGL
jgi:hypothetical protein